jgi:hypothetical protein
MAIYCPDLSAENRALIWVYTTSEAAKNLLIPVQGRSKDRHYIAGNRGFPGGNQSRTKVARSDPASTKFALVRLLTGETASNSLA